MATATAKPARMDITKNIPWMRIGMGDEAAYKSGYRHGYEGVNTSHICCLTLGTSERNEWFRGYFDGAGDSGKP